MNINKLLGSVLVVVLLMAPGASFASSKSLEGRIAALKVAILEAHDDSQISKTERDSLLIDWEKLNKLLTTYLKDKKLNKNEEKTLDSKIKKFDLNLFRKKYDQ